MPDDPVFVGIFAASHVEKLSVAALARLTSDSSSADAPLPSSVSRLESAELWSVKSPALNAQRSWPLPTRFDRACRSSAGITRRPLLTAAASFAASGNE